MDNTLMINFEDADSSSSDTLVSVGKHRMRVKGFERSKAKTGTHQIRCDLEILGSSEFEGSMKREYFPLDPKALWRLAQFLKVVSPDRSKIRGSVDISSIVFEDLLEGCIGEELFICYGKELFEGMEKNFARQYLRIEGESVSSPLHKAA